MQTFLREWYEPSGQSIYFPTIHQEQSIGQVDSTVDDFYSQIFAIWLQLDTFGSQLSTANTCVSCKS